MPIGFYDGESELTMPNGSVYSPVELKAVPKFNILGTEKCVIWQDTDGVVTRYRRWLDLIQYLTEDEQAQLEAGDLDDNAALDIVIVRLSSLPLTVDEVSDALIETNDQVLTNTDDIALCMDAIIEIGGGLKEV